MIEVKLTQVRFWTHPEESGEDKTLVFFDEPTQTYYVAPFSPEAQEKVVKEFSMSNEELRAVIDRRESEKTVEQVAAEIDGETDESG